MNLVYVTVNKLDPEQSECQIINGVKSLRDAVKVAFFGQDVDFLQPMVSSDLEEIVSSFEEHPDKFVWDVNEDSMHIFFIK